MVLSFQQSLFRFMELFTKGSLFLAVIVSADSSWQNLSSLCLTIQLLECKKAVTYLHRPECSGFEHVPFALIILASETKGWGEFPGGEFYS